MSKSRMINTSIWDDDYFVDLTPEQKLSWFYLLTNPSADLRPFFQLPSAKISEFRLGTDFKSHIAKFEIDGKIKLMDGYVFIINWEKHQALTDNMKKGIQNGLNDLPDKIKDCFNKLTLAFIDSRIPNPSEPFRRVTQPFRTLPNPSDNRIELNLTELNLTELNLIESNSTQATGEDSHSKKEINKEKVEANASSPHSQDFQEIHDLFDPEFENKTALENTVALLIRHFGIDFDLIANFKGYLEQVKKEPYTDTNSSKIKFVIKDFQNLGCPRNYYSPPKKPDKYASLDYSDEKIQAKIDYLRETTKLRDPEILDMILEGYEIPPQPPKPAIPIQIKGNMASEIEKFLNSQSLSL